jgi:hypothetical protein
MSGNYTYHSFECIIFILLSFSDIKKMLILFFMYIPEGKKFWSDIV